MSTINKIKKQMKCLGLTQKDIAKHLRIDEKKLNLWMRGKGHLSYIEVWKLYNFLRLDEKDMIDLC